MICYIKFRHNTESLGCSDRSVDISLLSQKQSLQGIPWVFLLFVLGFGVFFGGLFCFFFLSISLFLVPKDIQKQKREGRN